MKTAEANLVLDIFSGITEEVDIGDFNQVRKVLHAYFLNHDSENMLVKPFDFILNSFKSSLYHSYEKNDSRHYQCSSYVKTLIDLSNRNHQDDTKEVLHELQHRTTNNLQAIIGLLSIQKIVLKNDPLARDFEKIILTASELHRYHQVLFEKHI